MRRSWILLGICLAATSTRAVVVPAVGCRAEWDRPTDVLVHTPGDELFLGVVHPEAALFERPFDIAAAAAEHRAYQARLRAQGARVYTLAAVLADGDIDELRAFARGFLSVDATALPAAERAEQETYRAATVAALSRAELVRCILERPTIRLRPSQVPNTRYAASYELAPVMNLYFTRDQQITTARGVVLGRMNSEQRAVETDILRFALGRLGIQPIGIVSGAGRLEGGDFLPAGDVAFIGQGLRTNAEGIRQLLEQDAFGAERVVVVKDPWQNQVQMHLDTWFNLLGPRQAVMVAERIDRPGAPARPAMKPTADVWRRGPRGYEKIQQDVGFQALVEGELGFTLVPVSNDDQLAYGINFLCLGPGRILAVDGVSAGYKSALAAAGVAAEWLDFRNLTGGYGAAHCCTQVLHREPWDAASPAARPRRRR